MKPESGAPHSRQRSPEASPAKVKGIQEDGRWGLGSGSLAGYEARKILVASWYLYFNVGRQQQGGGSGITLELELQAFTSYPRWVLGIRTQVLYKNGLGS